MPDALPSISTSRGWTTIASATAGFVTAMRVTSNGVVSTVERPAVRTTRSKPLASVACAAGAGATGSRRPAAAPRCCAVGCVTEAEGERGLRLAPRSTMQSDR